MLDVGCGIGDLAIEIVAAGATSATGYSCPRRRSTAPGARCDGAGSATGPRSEVGDGSKFELPRADIVAINRVVCCYSDADGILDRTLDAARSVYAISAPISSGATGLYNRTPPGSGTSSLRARDKHYGGLRTFIHDVDRIDGGSGLRASGGSTTSGAGSSGTWPSTRGEAASSRSRTGRPASMKPSFAYMCLGQSSSSAARYTRSACSARAARTAASTAARAYP